MITIISGTNRKNSEALLFARQYAELFKKHSKQTVHLIELENIPHDYFFPEMYAADQQASSIQDLQNTMMIPAEKFFFVVPEYNGSFPGALNSFWMPAQYVSIPLRLKVKKQQSLVLLLGVQAISAVLTSLLMFLTM